MSCSSRWNDSLQVYQYSVGASVAFTLLALLIRRCLALESAPTLYVQYYIVIGVAKMILSSLLLVFALPTCPENCVCAVNIMSFAIYPVVALCVGLAWTVKGCRGRRAAEEIVGDQDVVFDKVSTVEMA